MTTTDPEPLPPLIGQPLPGDETWPPYRRILDAYRLELGADEHELSNERLTSFMEAVRWWNSGAPELDNEPSPASEQLAKSAAFAAAGGDVPAHWKSILEQQHRETRLARAMPSPYRPGWRAPRSKHAPEVEERRTDLAAQLRAVWRLDHDGRGTTLHATADHAKASAEQHEDAGTYWRYDDDTYRLKRNGETIAVIRRVEVLGSAEETTT